MGKKRRQAVGREVVIHLDELRAYELNLRAARWKAAAKNYRDLYRRVYASRAKIIRETHGGGQDD